MFEPALAQRDIHGRNNKTIDKNGIKLLQQTSKCIDAFFQYYTRWSSFTMY